MNAMLTAAHEQTDLTARLVEHGVLVGTGVRGLHGFGQPFVDVFDRLTEYITRAGASLRADVFRFPPLIAREHLIKTDYLRSFPDLVGSVHTFEGDERDHRRMLGAIEDGEPWAHELAPAETMLLPAACYPLYPMVSGTVPANGRHFDVLGTCFRHEPSDDPARMQVFHQREYVFIGSEHGARTFRDRWLADGQELLTDLELDVRPEVANDPFFGRAGRMLADSQRDRALKYELVATVADDERPTAITSCNCHLDHLTGPFEISTPDGTQAHSACVGFGMERIALALFSAHGPRIAAWPKAARQRLWP